MASEAHKQLHSALELARKHATSWPDMAGQLVDEHAKRLQSRRDRAAVDEAARAAAAPAGTRHVPQGH